MIPFRCRLVSLLLLAASTAPAAVTEVPATVPIGDPDAPHAVGFNEGTGGLDWTSADAMKRLVLTIDGRPKEIIDSQLVTTTGVMWNPPPDNAACTVTKVWRSVPFSAETQYRSLFAGRFCSSGSGGGEGGGTATPTEPKDPPTWAAGVLSADIDADTDNDSRAFQRPPTISGSEGRQEEVAEQRDPGLFLCVNAGRHEGGGADDGASEAIEDWERPGIVLDDPNIAEGLVTLKLPDGVDGVANIAYQAGEIRIYAVVGGSFALIPSGTDFPVSNDSSPTLVGATEDNPDGDFQQWGRSTELRLEGLRGNGEESSYSGDIHLTLTPTSGGNPSVDVMKYSIIDPEIVCTPRVVAADSTADVPIYFRVNGVDKVEIQEIGVRFYLEGVRRFRFATATAFVGGDAVRTASGSGLGNGEANDYTVLVEGSIYDTFESPGDQHVNDDAEYDLELKFTIPDQSGATFTCHTPRQPIQRFLDRRGEVIELGVDERIAAYKALTRQRQGANGIAVPFARHWTFNNTFPYNTCQRPHYATPGGGCSPTPVPATEAQVWEVGFDVAKRRRVNVTNRGYELQAELHDDFDFSGVFGGWGWTTMIIGEERGVYFILYYGQKELAGKQVVDIRKKNGQVNAELFSNGRFRINVGNVGARNYNYACVIGGAFGVLSGVLGLLAPDPTLLSKAAGWTALASSLTALTTCVSESGTSDGAWAGAWGGLAVHKPDGTPFPGEFDTALGQPTPGRNTLRKNGTIAPSSRVVTGLKPGQVFSGWHVFTKASASAQGKSASLFTTDAESSVRMIFSPGFTSNMSSNVVSTAQILSPDGECNEGE